MGLKQYTVDAHTVRPPGVIGSPLGCFFGCHPLSGRRPCHPSPFFLRKIFFPTGEAPSSDLTVIWTRWDSSILPNDAEAHRQLLHCHVATGHREKVWQQQYGYSKSVLFSCGPNKRRFFVFGSAGLTHSGNFTTKNPLKNPIQFGNLTNHISGFCRLN
jgi:hypothetical protein